MGFPDQKIIMASPFKGELQTKPKLSVFVRYLKIIDLFFINNMAILK